MNKGQLEWDRFCHTGLVQDYLAYCQACRQEAAAPGGNEKDGHEDHNRRNRHPGPPLSG